jgi:hypothetical protein
MITGNSVILQCAKETTFGTVPAAMTAAVHFTSADFKPTITKKDEGLLTGGKIGSQQETMSIKSSGSISALAKPETVGIFLKGALGVETVGEQDATTKKYKHTFTPLGTGENDFLPSFSFVLDRKAAVKSYPGMTIDSITMSAASEDYLKVDATLVGQDEDDGAVTSGLVAETAKAMKFRQGKAYIGSTEIADVTSMKFEYKNSVSSLQTTSTGVHFTQPQPGTREITSEIELVYSTVAENLRKTWYRTDDILSLKLEFDDETGDKLSITIPAAQITAYDPPAVSGKDAMKQSFTATAVSSAAEPVTIDLYNDRSAEY